MLESNLTTSNILTVEKEAWDLHEIWLRLQSNGLGKEGMNVIKVADTFMLGNGSPGPSYSLTSSPHSMEYILIPSCTMT